MDFELEEAPIAELQERMTRGELSSAGIAEAYLDRIGLLDQSGPQVRSVIEVNPDALDIAAARDRERASGRVRGLLHGVPILVKDNIDTGDRMMTTAGSLALVGHRAAEDAPVVRKLRDAGAVVLGKLNMSEWANFRSPHSTSGWSARGGQCRNPFALDRTPWGSSSGSGAAASANFAAATIGTETDGSIVLPAAACGVVGIKPTVGLTSRRGVIPVSTSQDSVGPLGRTVADAAAVLSAIAGGDGAPAEAERDYTRSLNPDALKGARLGVPREIYFGYSEKADAVIEEAIGVLRELGAVVIDPADIPTARHLTFLGTELTVLLYETKAGIDEYLAGVEPDAPVHSLADVIAFNEEHADEELAFFGQEFLELARAKGPLSETEYVEALARNRKLAREDGIDAVMERYRLDALVMPTTGPAWKIDLVVGDHVQGMGSSPAAQAGYPLVTVPAGYAHGLPIGLLFTGRAYSEPTLIGLAYAFEQATRHRRAPRFEQLSLEEREAALGHRREVSRR
jgi:amidase